MWRAYLKRNGGSDYVFILVNVFHRPLTVSGINQLFHKRLAEASLPQYRVHDLRHSFANHALNAGYSLSAIQRQLGHKTSTMTLKYTQATEKDQEVFIQF